MTKVDFFVGRKNASRDDPSPLRFTRVEIASKVAEHLLELSAKFDAQSNITTSLATLANDYGVAALLKAKPHEDKGTRSPLSYILAELRKPGTFDTLAGQQMASFSPTFCWTRINNTTSTTCYLGRVTMKHLAKARRWQVTWNGDALRLIEQDQLLLPGAMVASISGVDPNFQITSVNEEELDFAIGLEDFKDAWMSQTVSAMSETLGSDHQVTDSGVRLSELSVELLTAFAKRSVTNRKAILRAKNSVYWPSMSASDWRAKLAHLQMDQAILTPDGTIELPENEQHIRAVLGIAEDTSFRRPMSNGLAVAEHLTAVE